MSVDPGYIFSEKAAEVAQERGLIVRYPKPNELFIDIDDSKQFDIFHQRISDLESIKNEVYDQIITTDILESASGYPHRHIIVQLFKDRKPVPITDLFRVTLQFVLGSDPIRETLTLYRILAGIENPSCLFEKEKVGV